MCITFCYARHTSQREPIKPISGLIWAAISLSVYIFTGVVETINSDKLIKEFGQNQLLRKGDNLAWTDVNQIRGKLRFLARLVHAVRDEAGNVCSLSELLHPSYYDAFVTAVLKIRTTNKQLALTLGHFIRQVCLLNIAQGIKTGNKPLRKNSEDFLQLYTSSWGTTVASSTLRMQQQLKLNKERKLPISSDLVALTQYVQKEVDSELDASQVNYNRLQKLVLAGLLLYNKRRPAEIADIKVSDYRLSFDNQEDRPEILQSLTAEERIVASRCAILFY